MGKMQRTKGKRFELFVAKEFRKVFPTAARTLTQQRDSGEAPDVQVPGLWIEAKAHKRVNVRAAWEQAEDEANRAESSDYPVAVTKDNRAEPLATMLLEDFLGLLTAAEWQRKEIEHLGGLVDELRGEVIAMTNERNKAWEERNVLAAMARPNP